MAIKSLDENSVREVGQSLHVENMESMEQVLRKARLSFSKKMREAFDVWAKAYCEDASDVHLLQSLVKDFARNYGEAFAYSFFVYGVRWKKLSFYQFELVLNTIDQVSGRAHDFDESGMRAIVDELMEEDEKGDEDVEQVDALLAAQKGAIRADRLISLFLRFEGLKHDPKKSAYVAGIIVRHGKDVAERACFLMDDDDDFSGAYFQELLLMGDNAFPFKELFLDACERWGLTSVEAKVLRKNVLHFYRKKRSYDAVKRNILGKNERPTFLKRDPDSLH